MTRRPAAMAAVIVTAMMTMGLAVMPQPLPPPASEAVVRQLYTAFNAHDAAALVARVSDDVRWMTVAGDAVVVETSGREALRASMTRYFRSTPTVRSRIAALMPAGEFVTVHERVTWMRDSTEKTQSAVAVYRIRNAQIVSVWYFDVLP
jgi:hypothetical protein